METNQLIQAYKALQETTTKYSSCDHTKELTIISDMLINMILNSMSEGYYTNIDDSDEA